MTPHSRYPLWTLFVAFFCAAVGLSIAPHPSTALNGAIATAMVIGLVQQIRQLRSSCTAEVEEPKALRFARRFGIAWRVGIATVIAGCLLLAMLYSRHILPLPEHDIWLEEAMHELALSLSVVLVLCNSLTRWSSTKSTHAVTHRRALWYWVAGAAVAVVVITNSSLVIYLVHVATARMEADIPSQFQRPGVYPRLRDEGYATFWLASAASLSLCGAGAVLMRLSRTRRGAGHAWPFYAAFLFLLALPVGFSYWYYTTEFARVSPELAGAGLVANASEWLGGTLLATILITGAAYGLSKRSDERVRVVDDLSHGLHGTALHETWPCLILLLANALWGAGSLFAEMISSTYAPLPPWWVCYSMFFEPSRLLTIVAPLIVTIQLVWVRWRCRGKSLGWDLSGLPVGAFVRNWIAFALLLIVAISTLNAFAFVFWLGPFNYASLIDVRLAL